MHPDAFSWWMQHVFGEKILAVRKENRNFVENMTL
jgi:hypothetical protein